MSDTIQNKEKSQERFSLGELFNTHFESLVFSPNQLIQGDSESALRQTLAQKNIQNIDVNNIIPALDDELSHKYIYVENPTQKQHEFATTFNRKNVGILLSKNKFTTTFLLSHYVHFSIHPENIYIHYPIFLYSNSPKNIKTVNFNRDIITKISLALALDFLPEEPAIGNVCFVQNPDLRDDFKTYFTPLNLVDYLLFFLQQGNKETNQEILIPFPKEKDFWTIVRAGEKIKNIV